MADPKVLAWGVVCGSGELHYYRSVEPSKAGAVKLLGEMLIEINQLCGPHRVVALVERPEEGR